ncbi:MAG: hypothetical protein WDO68_19920 [Gammaproteobacteria bacterium]
MRSRVPAEVARRFSNGRIQADPAAVPLSDDYFATENTAPVAKGEGAWKSVTGYGDLQRRYFDPVNETAAFFGILKKEGHDQITSVRIKVAGGKVSEAEWIFGTQGPGGRGEANPAGLLKYRRRRPTSCRHRNAAPASS